MFLSLFFYKFILPLLIQNLDDHFHQLWEVVRSNMHWIKLDFPPYNSMQITFEQKKLTYI